MRHSHSALRASHLVRADPGAFARAAPRNAADLSRASVAGADRRLDAGDGRRLRLGVGGADRHEARDHRHLRRPEVAGDDRADPQGAGRAACAGRTCSISPSRRPTPTSGTISGSLISPPSRSPTSKRDGSTCSFTARRPRTAISGAGCCRRRTNDEAFSALGERGCSARRCSASRSWPLPRPGRAGQQPPPPVFNAQPGRERRDGLRRELRELPHGRPRRPQRSAAARRQQLHEHLAQRDRRRICSSSSSRRCRRPARTCRAAQYLAVTAYILQANGAPAGEAALTATTAVPIGSDRDRRDADRGRGRGAGRGTRRGAGGRQGAPARGRSGARRRTRRRGGQRRPARRHRRRHGEELRAGHRRDAAQSGSRRLADGAPQLSGLEPQSADADHARQRQGSAAGVELGDERGPGNEPSPLVHNGVLYLVNIQNIVQAIDARTGDLIWENHVGPERADRPGGDAQHGDLPGQGVRRHHRRAAGRARRAHRREGLGHDASPIAPRATPTPPARW